MDKLTVCLLSEAFPPIIDGVSNVVLNYAYYLNKEWGSSMVAVPSYPGADDSAYPYPIIRYPSLDVRKQTTGYTAGIPFSPELLTQLTQQKVDIIHAHSPLVSGLLARALRKRVDAPNILTYHTKYDIDIANVVKAKVLQTTGIRSMIQNVNAFDEVWVVSEGAGQNLRSLGYQGDYIVMPNGVDMKKGKASPEKIAEVTKDYDLPENVPVYLFVGRLMWYKGMKIIIDAMKKLKDSGEDYRMVIIGDGGDGAAIRAYAESLDLNDKVFFTGIIPDREDIKAWYTRADLFLFPSTFDSNGLVVREAASCDLPAVLVKGSCAAEGIHDNYDGFLIEENAKSMALLLYKLSRNMDHVAQVGKNAGDNLYLSWEDAVIKAVERYNIVRDLYRIGAYEEHDRFVDNMFATGGDLMNTIGKLNQAINQGKAVTQTIISNIDSMNKAAVKKAADKKSEKKNDKKTVKRKIRLKRDISGQRVKKSLIKRKKDRISEGEAE